MIVSAGIKWYGAGEIIAWNTAAALDYSAAFAVQGWMGSPIAPGDRHVEWLQLRRVRAGHRLVGQALLGGRLPEGSGSHRRLGEDRRRSSKTNLNSTYLRVSLRWTGHDTRLQVLTSGLRYFQVQRRRNGGAWHDYGTMTSTPMARKWLRHSVYEFRVRARDRAGNWGAWTTTTIKT